MGAWGMAPWDNDSAADWFGDLFEAAPLAQFVEETLRRDARASPDQVRAAAALLVMLGRTYVWPRKALEGHLSLAIAQMKIVREAHQGDPEWEAAVDSELAVLEARLANDPSAPSPPRPSGWERFWSR
ncbi:MAG: DUF4259 domain-containing protein [Sandaracinaceae bacterium]